MLLFVFVSISILVPISVPILVPISVPISVSILVPILESYFIKLFDADLQCEFIWTFFSIRLNDKLVFARWIRSSYAKKSVGNFSQKYNCLENQNCSFKVKDCIRWCDTLLSTRSSNWTLWFQIKSFKNASHLIKNIGICTAISIGILL